MEEDMAAEELKALRAQELQLELEAQQRKDKRRHRRTVDTASEHEYGYSIPADIIQGLQPSADETALRAPVAKELGGERAIDKAPEEREPDPKVANRPSSSKAATAILGTAGRPQRAEPIGYTGVRDAITSRSKKEVPRDREDAQDSGHGGASGEPLGRQKVLRQKDSEQTASINDEPRDAEVQSTPPSTFVEDLQASERTPFLQTAPPDVMPVVEALWRWLNNVGHEVMASIAHVSRVYLVVAATVWPIVRFFISGLLSKMVFFLYPLLLFNLFLFVAQDTLPAVVTSVICASPGASQFFPYHCMGHKEGASKNAPKSVPAISIPDTFYQVNLRLDNSIHVMNDKRFDPASMVLINQALRRLIVWVHLSSISSKQTVILHLEQYIDRGDTAIEHLTIFNSHLISAIEWSLSITDYTLRDLESIVHFHQDSNLLETAGRQIHSGVAGLLGKEASYSVEVQSADAFLKHINRVTPEISAIVVSGNELLSELEKLKKMALQLHDFNAREMALIDQEQERAVKWRFLRPWTWWEGRYPRKVRQLEKDMLMMAQLDDTLSSASQGVVLAVSDFMVIERELSAFEGRLLKLKSREFVLDAGQHATNKTGAVALLIDQIRHDAGRVWRAKTQFNQRLSQQRDHLFNNL